MSQKKFNIYNSIIPLTERYSLLYNSFTNTYLLLSPQLRDAIKYKTVSEIKINHSELFKQLVRTECLIEQNTDEPTLLKNRILQVDRNSKMYHLTINPTINCNFKCWYCYEEHNPKSKMDQRTLNNTKDWISKIASNPDIKHYSLTFFGGEPLLFYWEVALPIIEHYRKLLGLNKKIDSFISFTTNGYLLNEKMIQSLKENQVQSFQITLDGTKDDHDNTRYPYKGGRSFDKIVNNIIYLLNHDFQVILRINYTKKNASKIHEIIPLFSSLCNEAKMRLSVNFQQVWQDKSDSNSEDKTPEYINKCIELFEESNIVTSHRYHNYVWNSCYADKQNEAVINYNGDVFKCTARDFTRQNRAGYLSDEGTIIWDEEKRKIREDIRFTKPQCHSCRIAPICGGSCSQRHLENIETKTCLLGYDEAVKDKIILDKFYDDIVKAHEEISL